MGKTLMLYAVVLAATLGMTACEKKMSETASDAAKSAGQTVGDAAKATGTAVSDAAKATGNAVSDAAKATGDYLTQSKDSAVQAAQETLNGPEKKWQDLQAKAAPTTDAAKADLQKVGDQMAQTLSDARAKLAEAKVASTDAWQENVKPSLDAALAKAQKLYEDAAARFSAQ
jgi:hypothetical protein